MIWRCSERPCFVKNVHCRPIQNLEYRIRYQTPLQRKAVDELSSLGGGFEHQ